MKKIIQLTLLLVAILVPATASSIQRYQFESDCVYYKIVGNEAMVTCMYDNSYYDEDYYVNDYSSDYSGFVVIPETVYYNGITYPVTAIDSYTFYQCSGLTSVTIPNSVTSIGEGAFYGCNGLTSIPIANSVTTISNYAFSRCTGLTSVTIPESVTTIGNNAFYYCTNLSNITIPNSVTSIGAGAFAECFNLSNITIPNSVTTIGTSALDNTAWYDNQPNGVVYAGYVAYSYKGNMTNGTIISLKYGTVGIADCAFACMDPEGDGYAPPHPHDHYALGGINMPNTLKVIGSRSFDYCWGLTSINIPNSVTSIGRCAFYDCKLKSITIGKSVTSIGDNAFNCYYTEDTCLNDVFSFIQNPTAVSMGNGSFWGQVFPNFDSKRKLHVPFGTLSAYETNSQWRRYFGSIVEMDPVLSISIKLNVMECEMTKGETLQLTATVLPEDATDKSVTWTSSDVAVATVDQNGLVTAVGAGTATITATTVDGSNLTASCAVTVEPNVVLAASIELNQTSASVTEGETLQLTATVMPEDATEKTVTWESSSEDVATVDQNGLVTAVAAGTATITATTIDGSELSASCEVTVNGVATVNNTLDADALSARCGEEKQLAVRMDNESSITALQCDIYLPEGVSIATEDGDYLIDLVPARKATNHTVSTNDLPNGAIRLFITSATSKPFKGNSGDVFILNLVVDGDAESGEYSLDLRNIILSDTEAHPYYVPDLNVPVTIMDYIKGDVNIDGTVNVSDYVATANYILELDPHPFLFVAADIDENLTINVSDLVGVANIALNFMSAPAIYHAPAMGYGGEGLMSFTANCSTISPNRHVVTLDLSNSNAVTAFQMDINLPDGMKLVDASLSDRATASHSLEMTTLASGAYRLLGASMMSKAFASSEGALLTLEIEGDASGAAVIDGIMLAEPDATLHQHDAMTLALGNSGVHEMMSDVNIYLQDGMVVVESPVASKVQFILPNGMSVVREVKAGRNVYNTGLKGVVIVKVGNQVNKFRL